MSILCFAENPGGANGVIALASKEQDIFIHAKDSAIKYIQDHGFKVSSQIPDNITAIFTGAPHSANSSAFDYILRAREVKVPSFAYVDACVNSHMRFKGHSDDPLYYAPDYLFVTEKATIDAFTKLGFDPNCIFEVGNPRYDFVVSRTKKIVKKTTKKKSMLFLSDPMIPRVGCDYKNSGFDVKNPQDVRSFILLNSLIKSGHDFDIIIKLHPRNSVKEFIKYQDICRIYQGNEIGIDMAFQSDLVIGTTTSLLVESALVGVPTIAALLTPQERSWLPHILPDNLIISHDNSHFNTIVSDILNGSFKISAPSNKGQFCRNADAKMLNIINSMTAY